MRRVLAGRTAVPTLPEPFVPRVRLLATLNEDGAQVALVCAPAGFGKTALLAHWARAAAPATPVAWADLGGGADEQIWPVILTALRACPAVPPDSALHELGRSGPLTPSPGLVAEVVHALDVLPVRVALVLHDVHKIAKLAPLAGLEALVGARPAGVRLVLCSRWDTPLSSLGVLRSAGRLREIRVDQLRFSTDETDQMLRRSNLHLDWTESGGLHACTNGWPTGVRLAAAALRGGADPGTFLQQCAAAPEPVAEFLIEQVLDVLPVADRELLAAVGVGGPITSALATTLSGRRDAGEVLERLARETGLLQRDSAGRFWVHPLVSPQLRAAPPACTGRALAAARRPNPRTARLDHGELQLLAHLPSLLSVHQIAQQLRIPPTEASARIRAVYRKLGVSSRRTAVSVAYERRLLR